MPNYRQELSNRAEQERLAAKGQEMENNDRINAHANIVADRRDQEFMRQHETENMQNAMASQSMNNAYNAGATDIVDRLGMGSKTIEGMNQLNQVSQESKMQASSQYVNQAIQGLKQGMDPREIDQMITDGVEPELQGTVRNMLGKEIQKIKQAEAQIKQNESEATNMSKDIMAEMEPQQKQQQ